MATNGVQMIDLARVAWLHQTEHVKPGLSALVLKGHFVRTG